MNELWKSNIPGGSGYQDHTLSSPELSNCSTSPISFFSSCQSTPSQESDCWPSKTNRKKSNSLSSQTSSVFEFPSLDELREMGCDLLDGFWDEDQVQDTLNHSGYGAQSLNFTFDDGEDAYRPLQYPNHDEHAPTLTELNMEESQTFDSIFSLKAMSTSPSASSGSGKLPKPLEIPKDTTPITKRIEEVKQEQTGLSLSPTTWQSVRNSKGLSAAGLFVPAKPVPVDSNLVSAGSQNTTEKWRSGKKSESCSKDSTVDFVHLFGSRSRRQPETKKTYSKQRAPSPFLTKKLLEKELREKGNLRTHVPLEQGEVLGAKRHIDYTNAFPNKHFHKGDDDDDADSHDEGLGSENEEDHHDDPADDLISEDEDDDEVPDDASDYSEEAGPSCSTDIGERRIYFRSKRSEYDNFSPNPDKLLFIGKELQKLNKMIHEIKPSGDPSTTARNKTRREKNKLASRACRLKKKAQHEANKLKLQALGEEQDRLSDALAEVQKHLSTLESSSDFQQRRVIAQQVEKLIDRAMEQKVAGQTDSYVNYVLDQTSHKTSLDGSSVEQRVNLKTA